MQFDIIVNRGTKREFVTATVAADDARSALSAAKVLGLMPLAHGPVDVVECNEPWFMNDWEVAMLAHRTDPWAINQDQ